MSPVYNDVDVVGGRAAVLEIQSAIHRAAAPKMTPVAVASPYFAMMCEPADSGFPAHLLQLCAAQKSLADAIAHQLANDPGLTPPQTLALVIELAETQLGTLTAPLGAGELASALPLTALVLGLSAGTVLTSSVPPGPEGPAVQSWLTTEDVLPGATSVPVEINPTYPLLTLGAVNFTYPAGTAVYVQGGPSWQPDTALEPLHAEGV